MDTTNCNFGSFAGVRRSLPLAESRALIEEGSVVSRAEEAEANLTCSRGGPDSTEKATAVFRATQEMSPFHPEREEERRRPLNPQAEEAVVTPILDENGVCSEESQPNSPAARGQEVSKTSWCALPQPIMERIFQLLGLQGTAALSMVCKPFRSTSQEFYQPRCLELRAADGEHLFERFGIDCPGGAAPSLVQMKAMVARTQTIINAMTEHVPRDFSKVSLPGYTAEEWVLRAPAADFQALLQVAYQWNLCLLLFPYTADVPSPIALKEANERVRAWLGSDEARMVNQLTNNLVACRDLALTCLSAEIGQLVHLNVLDLANNQLKSLPIEIGNLVKLQMLYLGNNQLESLSDAVGQLVYLDVLDLANNRLKSLPVEIENLVNVQWLNLANNQLESLPAEIGNLGKLQTLHLGSNQLKSLPVEIGNLIKLQTLHLGNNQLKSLPVEIGNLASLRALDLANNQLKALPVEIGDLVNLRRLDLANNRLKSLPGAVGHLVNLQSLDLSCNQLKSLPGTVGRLSNLRKLVLLSNQLTTLSPDVWQFEEPEPEIYTASISTSALWSSIKQAQRLLKKLRLEAQQSLARARPLVGGSQQCQATMEPLHLQQQHGCTSTRMQLQQLDILQQPWPTLRYQQATQLLGQAELELNEAQKAFGQQQEAVRRASRRGATVEPEADVGPAALVRLHLLAADLTQVTVSIRGLLQELASEPALDPRGAQARLEMLRDNLRQKQAEIGSLYVQVSRKPKVIFEKDVSWYLHALILQLLQVITIIGELLQPSGKPD